MLAYVRGIWELNVSLLHVLERDRISSMLISYDCLSVQVNSFDYLLGETVDAPLRFYGSHNRYAIYCTDCLPLVSSFTGNRSSCSSVASDSSITLIFFPCYWCLARTNGSPSFRFQCFVKVFNPWMILICVRNLRNILYIQWTFGCTITITMYCNYIYVLKSKHNMLYDPN